MAFVAAPTPAVQAYGGLGPNAGKFTYGETIGAVGQQPPSPPWVGAPAGNRIISASSTTSYGG